MSLQSARDAWERGEDAQARHEVLDVLRQDPFNQEAWVLLMHVAANQEERTRAVERVLRLQPDHPEALEMQRKLEAGEELPLTSGRESGDMVETREDGAKVYTDGVYEMMWDCPYCGTDKLLGKTHRFCPNCGAAQDPEKRYFPSETEKVAVRDHVFVGADKLCPACETPNSARSEFCMQCGSPLSDAARAELQASQHREQGEGWREEDASGAGEKKSGGGKLKWIFLGLLLLLLGGGALFYFWTTDVAIKVVEHSWEREIKIQDYRPRMESAWCEQMPSNAYSVSRKEEVRSHKQVPDGETCSMQRIDQGDGTYVEKRVCRTQYRREPIYDDKCYFKVDRWAYARSVRAKGRDRQPYWPESRLSRTGNCLGCEREGGREAHYYLHLVATKQQENYQCEVEEKLWRAAKPGSRWIMEVSAITGGARCGSLERAK